MPIKTVEKLHTGSEVVALFPEGLGYGEGSIGVATQRENPERFDFTEEAFGEAREIITSEYDRLFAQVEADDDGCGDGRWTKRIIYRLLDPVTKTIQEFQKDGRESRLRAKVFGGGLVVAASMFRALRSTQEPLQEEDSVLGDRKQVAAMLHKLGIAFGGHTDNHAHGENCGCGAIDKYPQTTQNALAFRTQIEGTLKAVYGEEYIAHESAIAAVFASYEEQQRHAASFARDAAGVRTRDLLKENQAVLKELADDHLEDFVVLNDVEGTTFDQRKFERLLHDRVAKGTIQVFSVDIWRGRMYAEAIAQYMAEEYGLDTDEAYQVAEADFFIRTLAIAATLTMGDLPVFLHRNVAPQAVAALN